jgi:hypothetical protein
MNYKIAISHDVGISLHDFVTAWNETPECRDVAIARMAESRTKIRSFDPDLLTGALAVLGSIAAGVGTMPSTT